jgi:dihydrodipicolinate synthase/N-acetylneuraminate lyase
MLPKTVFLSYDFKNIVAIKEAAGDIANHANFEG